MHSINKNDQKKADKDKDRKIKPKSVLTKHKENPRCIGFYHSLPLSQPSHLPATKIRTSIEKSNALFSSIRNYSTKLLQLHSFESLAIHNSKTHTFKEINTCRNNTQH